MPISHHEHCRPLNRYGHKLLEELGVAAAATDRAAPVHPAALWAYSGLMALTGRADGPATLCPVPLASCADDTLDVLRLVCGREILPGVAGHRLLSERAALAGLERDGSRSTGGHCRLLPCADGVLAVNLARDSDWELVPAWLERANAQDWPGVAAAIAGRDSAGLVARARLLGLAVADATQIPTGTAPWCSITRGGERAGMEEDAPPTVVDLSSLWAGPLCSHLWQQAGARVIKVESERRPDGARFGEPAFFALLNRGKQEISLPLHTPAGIQALRELIAEADIVLEASRPRALRQMGIVAEEMLATHPGLTWVSITGYGRGEPEASWVAFGDDAAAAAGLSAVLHAATGQWLVCGDAIADPLTGLHAALAGWQVWKTGGGALVDLSLVQTVRHCIAATAPINGDYPARQRRWQALLAREGIAAAPPAPRGEVSPSTH